jgi:hypothetical protein
VCACRSLLSEGQGSIRAILSGRVKNVVAGSSWGSLREEFSASVGLLLWFRIACLSFFFEICVIEIIELLR